MGNRGVSKTGGGSHFFGKGLDCVADPFGTVPLRCCYKAQRKINKLKTTPTPNKNGSYGIKCHWEIKGRFRKRVVLANVPSFRFSFRGNIRRNHPFGNHPFVNTKKGHWEIKGRFPKGWFWRTYPRSAFRSGGTSAKTTLLETTLLRNPENGGSVCHILGVRMPYFL